MSISSRLLLAALITSTPLLSAWMLSGCGSDEPSARTGPADAGVDSESGVATDSSSDAPSADVSSDTSLEADPDAPPDGTIDGPMEDGGCTGVDSDGDGIPDMCDICPGLDESIDTNGSGVPDCREALKLWLRADRDVFTNDGSGAVGGSASDGNSVRQWRDQGSWESHGDQTDLNRQPTFVESVLPSGPAVRFEGTGDGIEPKDVDSLDGPFLIPGPAARTLFIVARTNQTTNQSLLELNRSGTSGGSLFRVTPEVGVRVFNGAALFNHSLDNQFHILAVQSPISASTSNLRVWYDGIPLDTTDVVPQAINTGLGGYRLGDGHVLGASGFTGDVAEVIVYEQALSEAERLGVGLTLARKHGLKTWYVDNDDPVSVYLLAGQSNMVGQGVAEELSTPLDTTRGDVMAWAPKNRWSPLRWGMGNGSDQFGPELAFGRAMADSNAEARVALIKYAVNGTNLAMDWEPGVGPAYMNFISTLAHARQRLEDLGISYEIRGLLWMQGESDAMDENMAIAYQQNLTNFISEVRTTVGLPTMPVAIARLRSTMPEPFYHALTVRMAQESAAAGDPNVQIVDTDSLTLHSDDVHYDTEGQLQLGQRFATVMLQMSPP